MAALNLWTQTQDWGSKPNLASQCQHHADKALLTQVEGLTKEGEVHLGEVSKQQKPEKFACRTCT